MKQYVSKSWHLVILAVTGVLVLGIFAWQSVQTVFQKGIAESKNVRLSERANDNFCAMDTTAKADTPHFSGCNSLL